VAAPAHLLELRPRRLLRRLAQSPRVPSTRRPTSTPLIRSLEPGEEWVWCFVDEVAMLVDGISGHTRIPPSPLLAG
jgi:hypothetical protein